MNSFDGEKKRKIRKSLEQFAFSSSRRNMLQQIRLALSRPSPFAGRISISLRQSRVGSSAGENDSPHTRGSASPRLTLPPRRFRLKTNNF